MGKLPPRPSTSHCFCRFVEESAQESQRVLERLEHTLREDLSPRRAPRVLPTVYPEPGPLHARVSPRRLFGGDSQPAVMVCCLSLGVFLA